MNSGSGQLSLGVRSEIELTGYIEERFKGDDDDEDNNGVPICTVCMSVALSGVDCERCRTRLHLRCARQWLPTQHSNMVRFARLPCSPFFFVPICCCPQCPQCKLPWALDGHRKLREDIESKRAEIAVARGQADIVLD